MIIKTSEEAVGKVVLCNDGDDRRLDRFDDKLGYYSVPIDREAGIWMALSGVYILSVRKDFIGGKVIEDKGVSKTI